MRLYRGIESLYSKSYKNHVNSNYYEAWTDNKYLAKIYGNEIYCIEIQTENEIINHDGDRAFCFLNRQIETQGIKGNEFLLYTEHELYQQLNIEKSIKKILKFLTK